MSCLVLQAEARNSVGVFYDKVQEVWSTRRDSREYTKARYIGTKDGVFINIPGDRNPKYYDHTIRAWSVSFPLKPLAVIFGHRSWKKPEFQVSLTEIGHQNTHARNSVPRRACFEALSKNQKKVPQQTWREKDFFLLGQNPDNCHTADLHLTSAFPVFFPFADHILCCHRKVFACIEQVFEGNK